MNLRTGELSRRHLLQAIGTATAGGAVLSACQGGTHGTKGKSAAGVFQAAYPYDAPPKGNFNLLPGVSEAITMGYIYDLILIPGAMYYWDAEKYYYMLADPSSSVSDDGTTLTYKVRPGLKWSDGKPITAQDVYTTWTLEYILGNAAYTYVDKVTKTDDMTVTFHIKSPAPIAQYYILRAQVVSHAVYGKYLAEAEPMLKALTPTDDTKLVKLNQKISGFKPKTVVASGAFNFDMEKVSNASLSLVRNPHGYRVDTVKFSQAVVSNGVSDTDVMPLELSKKVDYATYGFTVADVNEFKSMGFRVLRPPTYFGGALFINYTKRPEFADKRVRQALAYAMDREKIGAAAEGESGKPVVLMTGISDIQVPKWMDSADQAKLIRYEHDLDKAAQMLTAAGWKRTGGKWYTPQGRRAEYDLITISQDADLSANAQSLQSQLGNFGFKITVIAQDGTQESTNVSNGKFDLAIQTWGSAGNPFPTAAFQQDVLTYNYPATAPHKGINFPLQQDTESVGKIDFGTAIPDSGTGPNLESLKAKITKLALAFNELLPIIPLYDRYGNNPVNTANITGWPEDGDPIYKNSIYADNFVTILMYEGKLKPA
ncbi:MAG TPA: ABC transporter substrate-binding protein [Mycobacteriales bacterium]|nr:ABC transporter substrate-binding protein [Mycobacteriales bacterium]